jgi:glycosyltransferase involved in cell wall biosynthesis
MSPRVTVIIPTYNWSTVLPYSIGSVLGQTFRDFELLVIGDGCTDESEQVVNAIADPRVRWINLHPGTGHQFGPNNEGLRQARGELIAYLGHDDLWLPHHLEVGVRAIDDGTDLTHSVLLAVDARDRAKAMVPVRAGWIPPTAVMHRRAVTEAVGGWRDYRNLTSSPEEDLWLRVAAAGYRQRLLLRLTGVKFPASERHMVYRERPHHQQAAWLQRIRSEPAFEATELARIAIVLSSTEPFARRVLRFLRQPQRWLRVFKRGKGDAIRIQQRYKGVKSR